MTEHEIDSSKEFDDPAEVLGDAAGTDDRRDRRLTDYLEDSLAKSDPLAAMLGCMNVDMIKIANRVNRAVTDAMEQPPEILSEMTALEPAFNACMRVAKQVERFSQMVIKLDAKSAE